MKKYGNGIDQFLADEPEISLTSSEKAEKKIWENSSTFTKYYLASSGTLGFFLKYFLEVVY